MFQEEIMNWETCLNEYLPPAPATIEDHSGEVICRTPDATVVKGEWDHSMTVVSEFSLKI